MQTVFFTAPDLFHSADSIAVVANLKKKAYIRPKCMVVAEEVWSPTPRVSSLDPQSGEAVVGNTRKLLCKPCCLLGHASPVKS